MFENNDVCSEIKYKYVLIASHQRSGTHLTIDTLRGNFPDLSNYYINIDRMQPKHADYIEVSDFFARIEKEHRKIILKTHVAPSLSDFSSTITVFNVADELMRDSKVIYVYRDGRDVLTSLYYFEKQYVPKPPERTFSEFLRSPSLRLPSGWPAEITPPERWARHVSEWLDVKGCLGISYEDITRDPASSVREVAEHLGLPAPESIKRIQLHRPSLLKRIFRRLTGAQFASSAVSPRKGIVGDWVNHFSEEDHLLFWDRAGPVMRRLGYS